MEKKHISVFGSCVSRNILNNSLAKSVFEIDRYAFQVCAWDAFSQSLDIDDEDIFSNYGEQFTARMVWYDLNKVALSEFEKVKSEYLMIDIYTILAAPISKISFKGKSIYAQYTYERYDPLLAFIENNEKYKDFKIEKISFEKFDKEIIMRGLEKFAEWVNNHYESDKVIIHIPSFAKKYFDINNNLLEYESQKIERRNFLLNQIKIWSNKLQKMIPNSKILDFSGMNTIAQFGIFDNINDIVPTYMHLTDETYIQNSFKMFELLNINYLDYFNGDVSPLGLECVNYRNMYINEKAKNKVLTNNNYNFTINEYFDKIENLKDFIIIFSAKDEASNNINAFHNKQKLGININLKFRDSYIAVIDKSRNFIYEETSQEKIIFDYCIDDKKVHIESSGFNAGNDSIITINQPSINHSLNKRGLNIVLLNSKTFEIVDELNCDSFGDKDLKITSKLLNNFKIKV